MHILPYIEYQILSQKTPEQITAILQSVTDTDRIFYGHLYQEFIGTIHPYDFRIVSNVNYRNSFLPVINGTLRTSGTSTIIDIHMQLSLFARIFLCLWLGILAFPFFILLLYNLVSQMKELGMFLVVSFFASAAPLMAWTCFYPPAQKAIQRLDELLR